MLMWINLMRHESHIKSEVTEVISRKLLTPSHLEVATQEFTNISPWTRYYTMNPEHPLLIQHF